MKDYYYLGANWEYVWRDSGIVSKSMWLVYVKNCPKIMHSQKLGANFEGPLFSY